MTGKVQNPDWQEIERAFAAVLDLPDDQKGAALAQFPPPIRTEVESLLEAYRRSGDFFAAGPAESVRIPIAVTPGTLLGHYRIEGVIGHGGMGVVHRALDTKLNRPVAVKFLFDDLADPAARRRFQR